MWAPLEPAGDRAKRDANYSIQYSPSVTMSLTFLKSDSDDDLSVPCMPLNLPVPPLNVVTALVLAALAPSAPIVVCVIDSQRPKILSPFSRIDRLSPLPRPVPLV